jgi:hypothetical protein
LSLSQVKNLEIFQDEIFLGECFTLNPNLLLHQKITDENLILQGIKMNKENLKLIDVNSLSFDFFMKLFRENVGIEYRLIPENFLSNEALIEAYLNMNSIGYNPDVIFHENILKSRRMIELILHKFPLYLSKMSDEIKNERECVRIALKSSSGALYYANERFRNDRELILEVFEHGYPKKEFMELISDELKSDRLVMIDAVKFSAYSFFYAPEELQYDLKFVIRHIEKSPGIH